MTTASPSRKTVAVVSDTPSVRDRFKAALYSAGHRAMIVKSVAQLLATVRADFDDLHLIVLDLRMPHASGSDLVKRIRKLDQGKLPILLFSGSVQSVDEVRELAARLRNRWTYAGDGVAPGQLPAWRMLGEFRFDRIRADAALYGVAGDPVSHSL